MNQLQLEVDGVTRTFAEWTRDFVDSYYPNLGHQCYRVPALHFNQQPLGHTAPTTGSEPHLTLNDLDRSLAIGDLAHTVVLERLEELSHHLQATGQGPLFIISAVNYDNYLAKVHAPQPKNKPQNPCSKEEPQNPCPKSKPEKPSSKDKPQNPCSKGKPQNPCSKNKPQNPCSMGKPENPCSKDNPPHPCPKKKPRPCSQSEQWYFEPAPESKDSHTRAQDSKPHPRSEPQQFHTKSNPQHTHPTPEASQYSCRKTEHDEHTVDPQYSQLSSYSSHCPIESQNQQFPSKSEPRHSHKKTEQHKPHSAIEDLSHAVPKCRETELGTGDVETDKEGEGKQLLPPRPSDRAGQRGEIDILLLHEKVGVVMFEVKAVGHGVNWTPSEEELQRAVQRRVRRAQDQLHSGRDVLHYVMPDLHSPHVTMVIALPYLTTQQLAKAVSSLSLDPNLRFMCKDDLSPPSSECPKSETQTAEEDREGPPQDGELPDLLRWWHNTVGADVSTQLPVDSMKTIVGRICGLMSVVSVWTTTRPRMEVRTPAQAIGESGRRLADIVLLPRQSELLADPSLPRLWLTGPMGSGKTLMLQLKGRQWLKEGKRVIVINVRTSSRGRPQGHVLEKSIWRQMENESETGSVERHDIALDEFPFESLHNKLIAEGSTDKACFVVDEVLCGMSIISQKLVEHLPHCPIWCVSTYVAPVPDTFQCVRLGAILRSPPSIQLMLKEIDLIQSHEFTYTTRSATRGLPCDGPPVIFIEHFKHNTQVRHLDCLQCANELADIFENKLGLKLYPPTAAKAESSSATPADPFSGSDCFQPTPKKTPQTAEAAPLSFQDILILVVLPYSVFRHVTGYHWEAYIPGVIRYIMYMCTSNFITGLRQRGVPLRLTMDNTLKEIAFPPKDEVIMSDIMGAHSLERKVVVLLRSGSPLTQEEVTEHISRYKTVQATSSAHYPTETCGIQELLTSPLENLTVSKQLLLFTSLLHEVCHFVYPQLTIPLSPSVEDAKAIFHQLLENTLVAGTQSFTREMVCKEDLQGQETQPVSGTVPTPAVPRRGMEYRCDLPVFPDPAHSQQEGPEASTAQTEAPCGEKVAEADSLFFVPERDLLEDLEQRQKEVKRIQRAMEPLSEDDKDWEFFAASRCLSQYISILS
ncbi:hypothetical protein ACOMHN_058276 [Nucella lapillus]